MNAQEAALAISNLRKQGRWERAIEEGRVAIKQWPTDRGLRLAIAWCLWKRVTEALKQDLDDHIWLSVRRDLKVVSEWANEAAGPSGYDRYDPLPLLVGTVMRAAKKENKPSRVVEASAFAEPNRLPDTPSKDFASHRMQWFSYLSWAYEESGNWSALIALEGLPIAVPKEDDRQWVIYRFARAYEETGNPARALELFDSAFPAVVHPWQRVARGRMLLASERHDEAVLEARRALASTSTEDLLLTIDAFHVIAKALSTSDRERALAHAAIAVAVRQRKGYSTDGKLRATFAGLGVTDIPAADEATFTQQAAWWKAAADESRITGHVSKKRDDSRPLMPVGTRVTFEPVSALDAKKKVLSWRALKVRRA